MFLTTITGYTMEKHTVAQKRRLRIACWEAVGLLSSARMCGSATIQLSLVLQTIGKGAIVGANSVVRGVVPANTIVAGAPARPIKIFNSSTGSWDKV